MASRSDIMDFSNIFLPESNFFAKILHNYKKTSTFAPQKENKRRLLA